MKISYNWLKQYVNCDFPAEKVSELLTSTGLEVEDLERFESVKGALKGAGVSIGLTYGKSLEEACEIGTRLATSVVVTSENVCPRFLPSEFGLDVEVEE